MPKRTPAMQQLDRFKKRFPDCVLFFRMGDFYEMFDDDAVEMSKALGLTLTERSPGQPMAGVPHHQLDVYLKRAVAAGYRIAIADQIQDPKDAKGVVARAVTRVVTPGTLVDHGLVDEAAPNRIAAACIDADIASLAVIEASTGAFDLIRCAPDTLPDELSRRRISELLIPEKRDGTTHPSLTALNTASPTRRPEWHFRLDDARQTLLDQFHVATLTGYGLPDDDPLIAPAGALVQYLTETQTASPEDLMAAGDTTTLRPGTLDHLAPPRIAESSRTCILDAVTLRALEVERTIRSADADGSLLGLFTGRASLCRTPMGKRLLRDWLCAPLFDLDEIESRQHRVATLLETAPLAADVTHHLDRIQDVARIGARLALGRATPRDLVALGTSLAQLETLAICLDNADAFDATRTDLLALADTLTPLATDITTRCRPDPPAHLRDGNLFRDAVDPELDETRLLQRDAGQWLADYQSKLIADHDLPGIKVGFNKVFGYYIELTAAQARSAPAIFARKQTLKNAERYITPELKDFEDKVTTAEARAIAREQHLFDELVARARTHVAHIRRYAELIAELDALLAFARAAERYRWTRPTITPHPILDIKQARHPVLDVHLKNDFVPNDLTLGAAQQSPTCHPPISPSSHPPSPPHPLTPSSPHPTLALITGPNMAGKSTFIRQTALITLLAHTGSYVPAESATIGLTDRIFTRVGADDALHAGQSTFMVEMTETANILNNATANSLIILDEIGRGTSTLDGLSLAWAIAEHLAGAPSVRAPSVRALSASSGPSAAQSLSTSTAPSATLPLRHSATLPLSSSPRTLFATHYHELTTLEDRFHTVTNLHVAVREWGDDIIFLHRILPGRTNNSYGVHVARLAGIPRPVIDRAKHILASLEVQHTMPGASTPKPTTQPTLFDTPKPHRALDQLRELKLESMSPLEAFDELRKLKDMAE